MSDRVKTFLAVAFLTVLVWVAIDFEVAEHLQCTIHDITVHAPGPDYTVQVVRPSSGKIDVTFTGPRGQISKLKVTPEEQVFRYAMSESESRVGLLSIAVAKGFEHLNDKRIVVKGADPEHIEVMVDRLIRLEKVPVHIGSVIGAVLAEGKKPRVEPETVEATAAQTALAKLTATSHFATATVDLSGTDIPEGGGALTRNIVLDKYLDGNKDVPATFQPDTVTVTLFVESSLLTKVLQDVPVRVSGPPEVIDKYEIVFRGEPGVPAINLKVSGPRDIVGSLLPREVYVYLEVTAVDKPEEEPGPGLLRQPRVFLPPGIKLVEQPPPIRFNLKLRGDKLTPPGG